MGAGEALLCGSERLNPVGCRSRSDPSIADWRFVGVDPAKHMLDQAQSALGALAWHVELHHVDAETAPEGPFEVRLAC